MNKTICKLFSKQFFPFESCRKPWSSAWYNYPLFLRCFNVISLYSVWTIHFYTFMEKFYFTILSIIIQTASKCNYIFSPSLLRFTFNILWFYFCFCFWLVLFYLVIRWGCITYNYVNYLSWSSSLKTRCLETQEGQKTIDKPNYSSSLLFRFLTISRDKSKQYPGGFP